MPCTGYPIPSVHTNIFTNLFCCHCTQISTLTLVQLSIRIHTASFSISGWDHHRPIHLSNRCRNLECRHPPCEGCMVRTNVSAITCWACGYQEKVMENLARGTTWAGFAQYDWRRCNECGYTLDGACVMGWMEGKWEVAVKEDEDGGGIDDMDCDAGT